MQKAEALLARMLGQLSRIPLRVRLSTPQANLWFLLSARCKAIAGSRSDLVPRVISEAKEPV